MPSHQTAQQAASADLPAAYVSGNAEADLLAGRVVLYPLSLACFVELPQRLAPTSQGPGGPTEDTSSSVRGFLLPRHLEVEEETETLSAPMETREPDQVDEDLDVRVDEERNKRVAVVEDRQEAIHRVFMVGTHPCIITAGGTRMACKKCSRYVTTYQGKWRNLGTLLLCRDKLASLKPIDKPRELGKPRRSKKEVRSPLSL
eukprot:1541811-Amphidinium_carterae.1